MVTSTRPRGRTEVREALIESAAQLFRERTPGSVTVRQIAEAAAVNQGLVHEYFGSKAGLITATLNSVAQGINPLPVAAARGQLGTRYLLEYLEENPTYARLVACLLLEGDLESLPNEFPAMAPLLKAMGCGVEAETQVDPRVLVGTLIAAALGWVIYRDLIEAAAGLDDTPIKEQQRQTAVIFDAIAEWNRSAEPLASRAGVSHRVA